MSNQPIIFRQQISLPVDPVNPLEAATKRYVDASVSGRLAAGEAAADYMSSAVTTVAANSSYNANDIPVGQKTYIARTGNTNVPAGSDTFYYIETLVGGPTTVMQRAMGATNSEHWIRNKSGTTWGAWVQYLSTTGTAARATVLNTARTVALTGVITATGVSFNGSANISLTTAIADNALSIAKTAGLQTALDSKAITSLDNKVGTDPASSYPAGHSYLKVDNPALWAGLPDLGTINTVRFAANRSYQTYVAKTSGRMFIRSEGDADAWGAWVEYLTGPLDLSNTAVGSAAKLTTPRLINGVAFDGTADINIDTFGRSTITGTQADLLVLNRTGSNANSVMAFRNTAGVVYAGNADGASFGIGADANVNHGSDPWLKTSAAYTWASNRMAVVNTTTGEAWLDLISGQAYTGTTGGSAKLWYRKSDNNFGIYATNSSGVSATRLRYDGQLNRWRFEGGDSVLIGNGTVLHSDNLSLIPDAGLAIGKIDGLQAALDGKLGTTANAATATRLQTARTIGLGGLLSGSASFNGSANVTIAAAMADGALSIAKTAGLQTALDGKLDANTMRLRYKDMTSSSAGYWIKLGTFVQGNYSLRDSLTIVLSGASNNIGAGDSSVIADIRMLTTGAGDGARGVIQLVSASGGGGATNLKLICTATASTTTWELWHRAHTVTNWRNLTLTVLNQGFSIASNVTWNTESDWQSAEPQGTYTAPVLAPQFNGKRLLTEDDAFIPGDYVKVRNTEAMGITPDDLTSKVGWVQAAAVAGNGTPTAWMTVWNFAAGGGSRDGQFGWTYNGDSRLFFRSTQDNGGGWKPWYEVLTTASFNPANISVLAGNGMSGGGTIAQNRTITLGTPSTLTGSSTNTVSATSHSHALSTNLKAWDAITPATKLDANAAAVSADKLTTARTIYLVGDFIGSSSFDGSTDVSILGRQRSYASGGTGNTYAGQYVRIARATMAAQYEDSSISLHMQGYGDGSNYGRSVQVRFRVKQQNSLPTAPFVNVDVERSNYIMPHDFYAVIGDTSAFPVTVDLYVKMSGTFSGLKTTVVARGGSRGAEVFDTDGYVAELPAGTVVLGVGDASRLYAGRMEVSDTLLVGGNEVWNAGNLPYSQIHTTDSAASGDLRFASGDGRGMRFWDSDNYKIWMASSAGTTWGGRLAGDTTSDFNMYFRMSGGPNRGFVFENSYALKLFSIHTTGVRSGVDVTAPNFVGNLTGNVTGGNSVSAFNPTNNTASITMSWLANSPRLRIGGIGTGAGNTFRIQGEGDFNRMSLDSGGNAVFPGYVDAKNTLNRVILGDTAATPKWLKIGSATWAGSNPRYLQFEAASGNYGMRRMARDFVTVNNRGYTNSTTALTQAIVNSIVDHQRIRQTDVGNEMLQVGLVLTTSGSTSTGVEIWIRIGAYNTGTPLTLINNHNIAWEVRDNPLVETEPAGIVYATAYDVLSSRDLETGVTWAGTQYFEASNTHFGSKATSNVILEIGGRAGTATSTGIDFHSSGGNNDFDSRIMASGGDGSTNGAGTLTISAATFALTGDLTLATSKKIVFGNNSSIIRDAGAAGTVFSTNNGTLFFRAGGDTQTSGQLALTTSSFTVGGNTIWHAGNSLTLGTTAATARAALELTSVATADPASYVERGLGSSLNTDGTAPATYFTDVAQQLAWKYSNNSTNSTGYPTEFGATASMIMGRQNTRTMDFHVTTSRPDLYIRSYSANNAPTAWGRVWTSANQGAGSTMDADRVDGLEAASFLRSDLNNTNDLAFASTDGRGVKFWNNDNYKIWMSVATNTTWGGRIAGETTSDYNMYFRMGGQTTNRGFVFENAYGQKLFSINPNGVRSIADVIAPNFRGSLFGTVVEVQETRVVNPAGTADSITMGWSNNMPRLRVGGTGAYPNATFRIQGVGDFVRMTLDGTGNVVFPGTVTGSSFVGNADSATKLTTPRTINGIAFDGTANIVIPTDGTGATMPLVTGGNINSITANGAALYNGSPTNGPVTADQTVVSYKYSSGTGAQLSLVYGTNKMYYRNSNQSNNAAWKEVATADTNIIAGNGLTGGGDLTATSRTLTLATPGTLTGTTANAVTASSHTHALSANLKGWDGISPTSPSFVGAVTGAAGFRSSGWGGVTTDGVVYFGAADSYIFKSGANYVFKNEQGNFSATLNAGGNIWTTNNLTPLDRNNGGTIAGRVGINGAAVGGDAFTALNVIGGIRVNGSSAGINVGDRNGGSNSDWSIYAAGNVLRFWWGGNPAGDKVSMAYDGTLTATRAVLTGEAPIQFSFAAGAGTRMYGWGRLGAGDDIFNILHVGTNNYNLQWNGSASVTNTLTVANQIYLTAGWFRTQRSGEGWYHEAHGGGWFMNDNTWIRTYGGKSVLIAGAGGSTGDLRLESTSPTISFYDTDQGTTHWLHCNDNMIGFLANNAFGWCAYRNGSNDWVVTGNIVGYSSDARLKHHIEDVAPKVHQDFFDRFKVRAFDWNYEAIAELNPTFNPIADHEVGAIAQEVEAIYPLMVATHEHTGIKTIMWDKAVPLLISEVQELRKLKPVVDELLQRLATLEAKMGGA